MAIVETRNEQGHNLLPAQPDEDAQTKVYYHEHDHEHESSLLSPLGCCIHFVEKIPAVEPNPDADPPVEGKVALYKYEVFRGYDKVVLEEIQGESWTPIHVRYDLISMGSTLIHTHTNHHRMPQRFELEIPVDQEVWGAFFLRQTPLSPWEKLSPRPEDA